MEQTVSVGTKQVMMDFYKDGSGVAFGKVAETPGAVEFGWPVKLSAPLAVDQGGGRVQPRQLRPVQNWAQ